MEHEGQKKMSVGLFLVALEVCRTEGIRGGIEFIGREPRSCCELPMMKFKSNAKKCSDGNHQNLDFRLKIFLAQAFVVL